MNNSSVALWGAVGILAVLLVGTVVYYSFAKFAPDTRDGVACTADAMQCPDGSYVGRTGPNCEFVCLSPVATSATTTGGGGILPYRSGIRGTVLAGPTCPVERMPPDPQCADRPYATVVAIYRASDHVHAVVVTRSDTQGKYSASLPPGDYLVAAGESMLPRCAPTPATVGPSGYTTANLSCDTGIR